MKIAQNAVVKMHYSVIDKDNNAIDSSMNEEPLEVIIGSGYLIPGLENALIGKEVGDAFNVTVPPSEGYGERHEGLMQAVPKSMFEGIEVEIGMQFRATTDDGEETVMILDIQGDDVLVDGNHPLSGIELTFDVKILEVREATADELAHGHVHSPGGCGHDHSH
ncbi:FKBP-type peptidyl-prolyl cis-trans isomerase [Pseudoalteromonas tunicata]|uniref:Peptidyl-prolyl cis-trans isomerase n=1 Tax=Pseudoalteromonas tunicata D2 TaxID=87626 RepID=A4C6P1_9GAMM|nr:peptidylprolyl isomerase [Pseudoalteromonas tunicata]ATC95619.1 FKBP-type peptidyl-prolyl cis-trans isomerase SlyD [Pseudoalteromonas tunicata]AXT31188.1 peptidylprolyl isomerase [Pseudoalteromonas tunicata]EAR29645.1 FKBP-type peptidyl prolyl cis-trans isomerase (rotamase) [Pseudoalteromonas tunicata D2]MDP4984981.1 peptidylprolyl isomerase [Pseudoalteromonas tunicata]